MYTAWVTRASDQGPDAGNHDNTANMRRILSLRAEESRLLGYRNFADVSLTTKMADSPAEVLEFLHGLARRVRPAAEQEFRELESFALQELEAAFRVQQHYAANEELPLSLDEAYLDVTENRWGEPLASVVARRLKAAIREQTGLTASAGVAPNKFLAKIASGWRKPDGLTVIAPQRVERFLQALPVEALWGVGPVTARKLHAAGIERLVQVREVGREALHGIVGSMADWLIQLARGEDPRPVCPDRPSKSASSESTYATDLTDLEAIRAELERMARENAQWLQQHRLLARSVTIKVRYAGFETVTRSHTLSLATRNAEVIASWALALLERTEAGRRPVRLLGARVHGLLREQA